MLIEKCRRCGGDVVQKSKGRLILVGVILLATLSLGLLWWPLFLPTAFCAVIGAYLLTWAWMGGGRWCRGCKRFDAV